ncbi:MAG: hypothetical protein OEV62_08520 [Actinomycetota bacterium]|nr:hypothetical protein [Actinomycetota bacterium]MDH4354121.1 hypothetical protein [Actinomycetota bacterium]
MAIVVEMLVPGATRQHADLFDASVDSAVAQAGGPPEGLMVHFARPEGDGFVICNVWRSEADMKPFYDQVFLPILAAAGLSAEAPKVTPLWAFARPSE